MNGKTTDFDNNNPKIKPNTIKIEVNTSDILVNTSDILVNMSDVLTSIMAALTNIATILNNIATILTNIATALTSIFVALPNIMPALGFIFDLIQWFSVKMPIKSSFEATCRQSLALTRPDLSCHYEGLGGWRQIIGGWQDVHDTRTEHRLQIRINLQLIPFS
ncbi:MAG: hypothetical protein WCL14_03090 [Bacteroidota bacterium]